MPVAELKSKSACVHTIKYLEDIKQGYLNRAIGEISISAYGG